jgi:hypothetical protein
MKESYYTEPIEKRSHAPETVEWVPVIDGVLELPPDLLEEFKRLTALPSSMRENPSETAGFAGTYTPIP